MTDSPVFIASYVVVWLVVLVQGLVLLELLRQVGLLRERVGVDKGALITLDGLDRGSLAPAFSAIDVVAGSTVTEAAFTGPTPNLFVFLSPRCDACRDLAAELPRFVREYRDEARVIVALAASTAQTRAFVREFGLTMPVLADVDQKVAAAYRSERTPTAVLIDGSGIVRLQGVTNSIRHLDALLREEGTPDAGVPWREITVAEPIAHSERERIHHQQEVEA